MSKVILITGVSGMIGSTVVKRAKAQGFNLIGSARSNHKIIAEKLGIKVINLDLLRDDFKIPKINSIIHCATANDILSKEFNAGIDLSVKGTKRLLDLSLKSNVQEFIFISTAQIYGKELKGKYNNLSIPYCHDSYSLNHYFGEEICKIYSKLKKFKVSIIRSSNIYGCPNLSTVNRETLVPTCFIKSLLQNGEIVLNSSGLQLRDFIHQDALADIILTTLINDKNNFNLVNACSGKTISILGIANLCIKAFNKISKSKGKLKIKSSFPKYSNEFKFDGSLYNSLNSIYHYDSIEESIIKQLDYYS